MKNSLLAFAIGLVAAVAIEVRLAGEVSLPPIFLDHMVLQRAGHVAVWGWAEPGEVVRVTVARQSAQTTTPDSGRWTVDLTLTTGDRGPHVMMVEGRNRLEVKDVLIGEVWMTAGQSNMELPLQQCTGSAEEIRGANFPEIRLFRGPHAPARQPQSKREGRWVIATPATVAGFSAVGYYFAKTLYAELKLPIGMVDTSVGGTPVETWISQSAVDAVDSLRAGQARFIRDVDSYPDRMRRFGIEFGNWLKALGREDKPAMDPKVFADPKADIADWRTIRLPAKFADVGLPNTGVIWLRKPIDVTPAMAQGPVRIDLGNLKGYAAVYWNGTKVGETTHLGNPGGETKFTYQVPADLVRAGSVTLAARVFCPAGAAELDASSSGSNFRVVRDGNHRVFLLGDWHAKVEYTLPPLTAASPRPPLEPRLPPDERGIAATYFNGHIAPLVGLSIRGVLWYQGEGNVDRAYEYRSTFPLLIKNWRELWQRPDLLFYFCQLSNFDPKLEQPGESTWAELREAQALTARMPATAMAVLIDIGEPLDIHPRNKRDVGLRLARIALARNYGRDMVWSGPVYRSFEREGQKIRIRFEHAESGLKAQLLPESYQLRSTEPTRKTLVLPRPGSTLQGFAICGADRRWQWADARIEGDTVIVWCEGVTQPVAVRYAWANNPTCNLTNGENLPAAPFRTDDFPAVTARNHY